jgi:hypothetical protein
VLGSKGSLILLFADERGDEKVALPIHMQFRGSARSLDHPLWLASIAGRGCRFQLSLWGFGGKAQCFSERRFCPE